MSECIYKTKDGFCTKFSDDEVKECCVEGPCCDYTTCSDYTIIAPAMCKKYDLSDLSEQMILLQKQMKEIQLKFNELAVQIEKAKEKCSE